MSYETVINMVNSLYLPGIQPIQFGKIANTKSVKQLLVLRPKILDKKLSHKLTYYC